MPSYRYRTATLLGPWRATSEAAVTDAIRSKQARRDEDGAGWHWVVPGSIEEREMAPQARERSDDGESAWSVFKSDGTSDDSEHTTNKGNLGSIPVQSNRDRG
jgi:hypothetical protein